VRPDYTDYFKGRKDAAEFLLTVVRRGISLERIASECKAIMREADIAIERASSEKQGAQDA
jgi:hypothetical protein